MKTEHLIFLILMMAAVAGSLAGVIALFWNAFQAGKKQAARTDHAAAGAIRWTEGAALTLMQKTVSKMNRALAGLTVKTLPQNVLLMIDPVDGTAFQKGDSIARCACGTNYHIHSWEWLTEKAEGRCVNCKRVVVPQRVTA